jgi:hypothetical protein
LAAAPFAHDFQKNGLKVALGPNGKPMIVNRSGRPASEQERQRLLADIRAEPAASAHDQNFFNPSRGGISRDDFGALKDTYRNDPARRATDFKHIVLTPPGEDKDFTRSQSCEIVSGECNPHAEKSYAKGEAVPAGDLARIASALRDRLFSATERHGRRRASGVGGLLGRLMARFGRGDASSGDEASGAVSGATASGAAADSAGDPAARTADALGGLSSSAGRSAVTPGRIALFLAGTAGTGLMFGAVYVLFKRDRRSWNR